MTEDRKTSLEAGRIVVHIEINDRQLALVDFLVKSLSTPQHEVSRSDVLRTLAQEGLEHVESGLAQLVDQSAKPEASA